jgi:hypothetical protein
MNLVLLARISLDRNNLDPGLKVGGDLNSTAPIVEKCPHFVTPPSRRSRLRYN